MRRDAASQHLLHAQVAAILDGTQCILTGEKKLIAREYLKIGDIVGKGHFGCVCEGNLFDPESEQTIQVAIKTLQANCELINNLIHLLTN